MSRQLWVAVATLVLCACGGGADDTVQVRGKVTDQEGSQGQSLGVRAFGGEGLGGTGTASAASKVRASTVAEGGSLKLVGEAEISAQGSYTVEVPEGQQKVVLQVVDASGTVVASALLDASGKAGDTTVAPPMDSESSLEAEVFTQIVASGAQVAQTDTVDLRARINAKMAAAAQQGATTREAVQARVKVLAEAVRAAQEAEIRAYAKAGVTTTQSALFDAELAASAKLNEALDAGTAVETAYQDFFAELAAAAQRVGAHAQEQAQAESTASVAFRATVKGRLSAQDAQPLVDASLRAAAAAESRASGAAITAILQSSTAVDESLQQAGTAATTLRSSVSAATTASAAAQAFAGFSSSVATGADVKTTVLGSYLGVNVTNQLAVSGAVQASATAAATLDAALDVAVNAAVTATQTDTTKLATGIADAYATYVSSVKAQSTALAVFSSQATPAVELLVVADGSFRLQ